MPPGTEKRARKGDPTRKAVRSNGARALLREAISELRAHTGIDDPEAHRADHAMLAQVRPLLAELSDLVKDLRADVIPYVKQQRQILTDKQTDNREVYKTIKIWAIKLLVALFALTLFYGSLKVGIEHLLPGTP